MSAIQILSGGYPAGDALTRFAIRRRLARRVRNLEEGSAPAIRTRTDGQTEEVGRATFCTAPAPIPVSAATLPFGPRRLGFGCYWPLRVENLAGAEEVTLDLICGRAEMVDGLRVLDASVGYGGVGQWIAERYPGAEVTILAADDSHRDELRALLSRSTSDRLRVRSLADLSAEDDAGFDRILAIETLQSTVDPGRARTALLRRLRPEGRLLVQLGCHRTTTYPLERNVERALLPACREAEGRSLPLMPATGLLLPTEPSFDLLHHWELSGEHYERTARIWLDRLDQNRDEFLAALSSRESTSEAISRFRSWRLAFLTTAELFGFFEGQEWWISQYLFAPAREPSPELADPEPSDS